MPIAVIILGAQLVQVNVRQVDVRLLGLCVAMRFALFPCIGAAIGYALRAHVSDKLTLFFALIPFATPPNTDCTVLAVLSDNPTHVGAIVLCMYIIGAAVMPLAASWFLSIIL